MNIVMVTNTYIPHVGGVARSVAAFTAEYRRRGHRVLVVAPEFPDMPEEEVDVVRIPAIQNFNGSDFSVVLPVSGLLTDVLDEFQPEVVHSHHPYLLGMTALRIARYCQLPLVFTHHTLYEQYTHYVPADSPTLKRFVIELATHYANLTDRVFAPSESIASLIKERGVEAPVTVIPTGVNLGRFSHGEGRNFRKSLGIPEDAFVVGHVGRLAPEKNLRFLAEALAKFLKATPRARVLAAGEGPSEQEIREILSRNGLIDRLHMAGVLNHSQLADAYHAMDVFAFSSKSETQGMVLTEAMAAGVPVMALDASGVREVVRDRHNGRLLQEETVETFAAALQEVAGLSKENFRALQQGACETAEAFSMPRTADNAIACYESLHQKALKERPEDFELWESTLNLIKAEWDIVMGFAESAGTAFFPPTLGGSKGDYN